MPGLSGIELQSRLLAQGCGTPIIFITAFPDETVEARAMKAGAIGFLSKPFDAPTLIRCLDAALKAAGRRNRRTVRFGRRLELPGAMHHCGSFVTARDLASSRLYLGIDFSNQHDSRLYLRRMEHFVLRELP